jgi:hypothetical protein
VDNIPAELLKYGGADIIDVMRIICQRIWETKKWPAEWSQSLVIPLPKKRGLTNV